MLHIRFFSIVLACAAGLGGHQAYAQNCDPVFSGIEAPADDPTGNVKMARIDATLRSMAGDPHYRLLTDRADFIAFQDTRGAAVWTFTKPGHRPHPAVVCREPAEADDGTLTLAMRVNYYGSTPDCDGLVAAFTRLNERAIQSLREKP